MYKRQVPNSLRRRSAQTALWRIGEALVRLVAPVMSFTADEIWSFLPKVSDRPESVHLAYFPKGEDVLGGTCDAASARALTADFDALLAVRDEALKALEIARQEKLIGRSEEAVITVHAPPSLHKIVERYRDDLRFLLIVSGVSVEPGNGNAALRVEVNKAPGAKCERCWNYSTQVGASERYRTVCERCLAALQELEEEPAV